jgi:DNA-directed RNA polymerase specialized sigma24 family protein
MTRSEVRQIIQIPHKQFVDFCLDYANLTPEELAAIKARERQELTITQAAEMLNMCETRHKQLYRQGMNKLTAGWDGQPWIAGALQAYKNIKQ